jgi:hypothetical protein
MNQEIKSSDFVESIKNNSIERFTVQLESESINKIIALSIEDLMDKAVIRLKRISKPDASWRTIIITVIDFKKEFKAALQWAAATKDELLDPETSDLYLIIAFRNSNLSQEECINIEVSEQFCRKYVLRPKEVVDDLINRTFLASLITESSNEEISDPLSIALNKTSIEKSWFNEKILEEWRNAFLSGESGAELVDLLFTNSQENINTI